MLATGANDGDAHFEGVLRWDDGEPLTGTWTLSPKWKSVSYNLTEEFISQAEHSKTLAVRLWDAEGKAYDARYDIRGLGVHLDANAKFCR